MKLLAIGGFFHDLNFTYYDLDSEFICSFEEERFSRIKSHSLLNQQVETEYLAISYLSCRYNIDLASIDVLIISDSVMPNCITEIKALIPNARIIQIGHYKSHFGNIFALNKNLNNVNSVLLALDGFGDGFSGASGYSSGSTFDISKFYSSTNSLGLLYTAATQHIGLGGFGSEENYKV